MAGGYQLLEEGVALDVKPGQTKGTLMFLKIPEGVEDLPNWGAWWGTPANANCKLTHYKLRKRGGYELWTCFYETPVRQSAKRVVPEDTTYSLRAGGEMLALETQSTAVFDTSANPVNQVLQKRVVTATYTVEETKNTWASAISGVFSRLGKLKTGDENWMFNGADIDQNIDVNGSDSYRVARSYLYRNPTHQHIWDKIAAAWDTTTPKAYETVASFLDSMPSV